MVLNGHLDPVSEVKILPRLLQIENAGLRLTGKTLGRDGPRLDIFLEIPPKQDIALPKTVSSVSDHLWSVLFLKIFFQSEV